MALTQEELDILAAGGSVNFDLPNDPGENSPDGIFFTNVGFGTETGDEATTAQGILSLDVINDLGGYSETNAIFVLRNANLTVGDDFGTVGGNGDVYSISGPNANVLFTGGSDAAGSSSTLRVASYGGLNTSGTIFIGDGADVTLDPVDPDIRGGIDIGVNYGAEMSSTEFFPGGQSVDGKLVIEGADTSVSVLSSAGGLRGSINIARVDNPLDGLTDTSINRSADGLVIIRDGANVEILKSIIIGDANGIAGASTNGSLVVEGANTSVTVGDKTGLRENGFMRIAEEGGNGSFILRDGAEFTLLDGDAEAFGAGMQLSGSSTREGGTATAIVTGVGTRLVLENGGLDIGRNGGTANLVVSDGAVIEALSITTAINSTADTVIEGDGTTVTLSDGDEGFLNVARVSESTALATGNATSVGSLIIRDGAAVHVQSSVIVADANGNIDGSADGSLIVEGVNTSVIVGNPAGAGNGGFMRVAEEGGTGSFELRDGAQFTLLAGDENSFDAGLQMSGASDREGGDATAIITGANTRLVVEDGSLGVGRNGGAANLTLSDGALIEARSIDVATNSSGTIIIEGANTRVSLSDDQEGYLNVARISESSSLATGNNTASGIVTIRNGAEVEVLSSVTLGDTNGVDDATADGSLIIEGQDTLVTVGSQDRTGSSGFMRIAEEGGTGALAVRDGAEIRLLASDEAGFGATIHVSGGSDRAGGTASVEVSGADTRLFVEQGSIEVGRNVGSSSFVASDGAEVETLFFTSGHGGNANTVFEGEGTKLLLAGAQISPNFGAFLTIGRDAESNFTLRDGADVIITGDGGSFPGFQVGRNDGSFGTLTVTGAGSTIVIDGADNLETGFGETGFIRAGNLAGSNGTIGVFEGGQITNAPTGILLLAQNDGSTGILIIDGDGSAVSFGATATFSTDTPTERGNAIVTISNGGVLEGGLITNHGILDVTSGGRILADLVQDNILRSSDGIEATEIAGDLTVVTGGFGFDFSLSDDTVMIHDTYTATGDVLLEETMFILAPRLADLSGLSAEIVSGANISALEEFNVVFVEFDANSIIAVDQDDLINANTRELSFSITDTSLVVDFGITAAQTGTEVGEMLDGSNMSDNMIGLGGDDTLMGLTGNDSILGGEGGDAIDGGEGNDTLNGGIGDDTLTGGGGSDLFVINAGDENILITDFELSVDTLDLTDFDRQDALDALENAQNGSAILTFNNGTTVRVAGEGVTPETLTIDDVALAPLVNTPAAGVPVIQGMLEEEQVIMLDVSGVTDEDGIQESSTSQQWLRNEIAIEGATDSNYTLTPDDVGAEISVRFEFMDNLGFVESVTSVAARAAGKPASVEGTPDAETLVGGNGNDTLTGLAGDDILIGGHFNDILNGGAGVDTAAFDGPQTAFTLTLSPTLITINDRRPDGLGIDQLNSIEFLDFTQEIDLFGDNPMDLDIFSGPAGLSAAEFGAIIELYIAYFNRAPDALGLLYWGTRYAEGHPLSEMANDFFNQDETKATYASVLDASFQLDTTDPAKVGAFVNEVYSNVLGRTPDQPGYNYWTGELTNNENITPANFILSIIGGAKFPSNPTPQTDIDQAYLATKSDLGAYFSVIKGMSDLDDAAQSMALFDGSLASRDATLAAMDAHYADALDPETGDFLMQLVGVIDDPFTMG